MRLFEYEQRNAPEGHLFRKDLRNIVSGLVHTQFHRMSVCTQSVPILSRVDTRQATFCRSWRTSGSYFCFFSVRAHSTGNMSSQQYSGQRQGPPRHVRRSAGYGAKSEGIAFPTAALVSVPASSRPMPAPPSQPHLSLPAVPGLYDGEQEGYDEGFEEGFEDDPFGPSPTYEPSLLYGPRAKVRLMCT